jgi:hypothetical protein
MKNAIFWEVTLGSSRNRRFVGAYQLTSVLRLLVTTNIVPSTQILDTLMMEARRSSEKYVTTRTTLRNMPEDGDIHSGLRKTLKSYNIYIFL